MWLRIIIITTIMGLVTICQLALLPNLGIFSLINLALVVLVLTVFVNSRRNALFCSALLGLLFDVCSFYWFGAHLLVLISITIISFLAVNNFFTNKSLYSYLFLISFSTILYDLYWLVIASWPAPIIIRPEFALLELQKIGMNLACGVLLFYLAVGLSNSFQSVILVKRKY